MPEQKHGGLNPGFKSVRSNLGLNQGFFVGGLNLGLNLGSAFGADKQSRFRVELGDDDILRLPHEMRSEKQAAPLPAILQQDINRLSTHVLHAKRVPKGLNATLLHEIFLHRGMEKVYKTLIHTRGYVAQRLPDPFCWVCAQAKAQRRGLHQHAPLALLADANDTPGVMYQAYVLVTEVVQAHVDVYDDDDNDDTSSDEGDESKLETHYVSPVVGRALGAVPVPRFDLAKIRPFEVMFVDNKDYEQAVRGGRQTTFIVYDVCSTAKFG